MIAINGFVRSLSSRNSSFIFLGIIALGQGLEFLTDLQE